jgi:hypothetical protein
MDTAVDFYCQHLGFEEELRPSPVFAMLYEWLPRAEGQVAADVNHLLPLQQPRFFAEAVARFLARHPIGVQH